MHGATKPDAEVPEAGQLAASARAATVRVPGADAGGRREREGRSWPAAEAAVPGLGEPPDPGRRRGHTAGGRPVLQRDAAGRRFCACLREGPACIRADPHVVREGPGSGTADGEQSTGGGVLRPDGPAVNDYRAVHVSLAVSDMTRWLCAVARPALAELEADVGYRRFFFVRYWEGGPHVRLR